MPTNETLAALQAASSGLTYESETDAPWEVVSWPTAAGEPTAAEVKKRGHHRPSAPTTNQGVDEFFAPLGQDQDWYGDAEKAVAARYRSLLTAIKEQLTAPTVVKVGERKVTVYVVGRAKEGGWAGLKTTAVET